MRNGRILSPAPDEVMKRDSSSPFQYPGGLGGSPMKKRKLSPVVAELPGTREEQKDRSGNKISPEKPFCGDKNKLGVEQQGLEQKDYCIEVNSDSNIFKTSKVFPMPAAAEVKKQEQEMQQAPISSSVITTTKMAQDEKPVVKNKVKKQQPNKNKSRSHDPCSFAPSREQLIGIRVERLLDLNDSETKEECQKLKIDILKSDRKEALIVKLLKKDSSKSDKATAVKCLLQNAAESAQELQSLWEQMGELELENKNETSTSSSDIKEKHQRRSDLDRDIVFQMQRHRDAKTVADMLRDLS
ncbi:unnamed protein product [Amoebophrya sp. A120]|nr:unnamed protein product [Amoebophrya sp. A120]|eukprot:GSA120T00022539001.1